MCQAKKVIYTLTRSMKYDSTKQKDLFLKIAGSRYNPRLCRGFRRQLILVPYAATTAHAHSPPAKQASSDITTATSAVLLGRRRKCRIQVTRTPSLYRQRRPSLILFSTQKY